jgi:DNA repair protein RadC
MAWKYSRRLLTDNLKNGGERMIHDKNFSIGHRKRLRQKFLETKLVDAELLELLLSYAIPRIDVKPIVKTLFKKFGTLSGIMAASIESLIKIPGMGESSATFIKVCADIDMRVNMHSLREKPIFHNFSVLKNYAIKLLSGRETEEFYVLYLDKDRRLISSDLHAVGTIDWTAVYPREILKRALNLNAVAIFLLHNHPGGNPSFSEGDIKITNLVIKLLKASDIEVMDHLLVAGGNVFSAKNMFLMN